MNNFTQKKIINIHFIKCYQDSISTQYHHGMVNKFFSPLLYM